MGGEFQPLPGSRTGSILLHFDGRPSDGPEYSGGRPGRTGEGQGQPVRVPPRELIRRLAQYPHATTRFRNLVDARQLTLPPRAPRGTAHCARGSTPRVRDRESPPPPPHDRHSRPAASGATPHASSRQSRRRAPPFLPTLRPNTP